MIKTMGERIVPENFHSEEEYILFLKHLYAYEHAKSIILPNSLVLEIGCGEGYGTYYLRDHVPGITGLDISEETVEHANSKYKDHKCQFSVFNGEIIPFEDNHFDAIVSFQVIEHVIDVEKYLKEIYRVIKKDGVFMLTTPNRVYRLRPGQKPWNRFHLREYSCDGLEEVLRANFSNVKMSGIRGKDEIQNIEINRVQQSNLKYIFRKIENLVPKIIRKILKKAVSPLKRDSKHPEQVDMKMIFDKYSMQDYYVIDRDIDTGLDLLGVCRK